VNDLVTLVQGFALAYAAGIDLYAAVAVTGLVMRTSTATPPSSAIAVLGSSWVIGVALCFALLEFIASSMPGIAAAWETVHSLVRPPAAAILAAAIAWQADPLVVLLAALVGGAAAIATHTMKLGLRYTLDATGRRSLAVGASVAELALVAFIALSLWTRPWVAAVVAIGVFGMALAAVRAIAHALRQVVSGHWMPARGLMQGPRASEPTDMSEQTNSPA
jgi:uncharacterized protein DUF4126